MVQQKMPVVALDTQTGDEKTFASFRKALGWFGVSPNRLYKIIHDGQPVRLMGRDGRSSMFTVRYKDDVVMDAVMLDEEAMHAKRYRPRRTL